MKIILIPSGRGQDTAAWPKRGDVKLSVAAFASWPRPCRSPTAMHRDLYAERAEQINK